MTIELVKGFKDYIGEDAQKRAEIQKVIVETFEKYGFEPAETPIIEYKEFVKGENSSDEAVSDIFKLQDKGERNLALRYEFTFQLKRLMQNKKLPYKRYQIGPVFRDEPVKGNRLRQFIQCDADSVGTSIKDDAEILALTSEILTKLGIDFTIYFNNRKLLNEILDKSEIKKKIEAIKEIDKLDKLSEKEVRENLKKYNAEKILDILKKNDFEKYSAYSEIKELEKYLKFYRVKAEFSPSLARGLSYYNGTVFEVKTKEMKEKSEISQSQKQVFMKETITAGGAYMFNGVQCTGISFGLDRISTLAKINLFKEKYLIVSLDQDKKAIDLAEKLRAKNNIASLYYGKPSKALEFANSYKYNKVIFVGEREVKENKFKIKEMESGREKIFKI